LLEIAQPKLDTKELHEIEIKKLSTKIGWSDDYCRENMIDSLRKLKTTAVQWNLTGVDDENDWTESTMLASFKVRKREGVIEYGYSPHLREVLRYPNVYAKLDTVIQKGLSSKYSLNLWEYCRSELFRVEGKECITEPVPIEDFRKILGIHDDRYPKFKIFNHSILKPAIAEVSEKTDVQVTVEKSIKEKRKIVALVFSISEKQAVQLGLPMVRKDKEREAVVQKMLAYNLSRKVIKNYLDENEPYEIAESIEAAEAFINSKGTNWKGSKVKAIRKAIDEHWTPDKKSPVGQGVKKKVIDEVDEKLEKLISEEDRQYFRAKEQFSKLSPEEKERLTQEAIKISPMYQNVSGEMLENLIIGILMSRKNAEAVVS